MSKMFMNVKEVMEVLEVSESYAYKLMKRLNRELQAMGCQTIAQYEKGSRSPKENYLNALADIFEVSPHALAVPDIDSYVGLMHTLFTLEDLYGLHIGEIDGELCLRLDKSKGTTYLSMFDMFYAWQEQAEKLKSGEITKEEYDQWRYNYPKKTT